MHVEPQAFKDALSRFASGVTVVTVAEGEEVIGITVSAFLSVSIDPPLVLVSIQRKARAHDVIERVGRLAVSILAAGQEKVSNHFAGWKDPNFTPELARPDMATPVVAGALAWIDCAVHQAVEAGDHTLYIGRVERLDSHDGEPLLYWRGKYRSITQG